MALLLFGGETLKDFAFALLVGILSGAYSSIFIASPVLTEWKEREPIFRRRRQLVMEDHGGVVPAYAATQLGDEDEGDGHRRTGRRVIAERPGRQPRRETRPAAPQRMAGPMAPEIEATEVEEEEAEAPELEQPELGGGNGDADAAARRAERRRQARAKRKGHGRR
jgi:SecD/SecF fusion protein